jgi:lipoyl(octanoyl) transferase
LSHVTGSPTAVHETLRWHWLGQRRYSQTLAMQHEVRAEVTAGRSAGAVLLCEHPPTITLGKSAKPKNVLATEHELSADGVELLQIDRGGDVTYHGPGQLMIYPVLRVSSLIGYLAMVAESIVEFLATHGVADARWQRDPAGVWIEQSKIAACGIHLARSVTTHGFALNLSTPTSAWLRILPCGLATPVISLQEILAQKPSAARTPSASDAAIQLGPMLCTKLSAATAQLRR